MTKEKTNDRTNCPNLMKLSEYLYGSMDKKEELAISSHVSSCPYCEDEMHELMEFVGEKPQDEFNKYYATHKLDRSPLPERLFILVEELSEKKSTGIKNLKEKLNLLIEDFKNLTSGVSFPLGTLVIDPFATRGSEQYKNVYNRDESIIIQLEAPPEKGGFMTVFLYDERDNLHMVLPKDKGDDTSIKAGEFRRFVIPSPKLIGKHYLKALITSVMLIDPLKIDFEDGLDIATTLGSYLESIHNLTNEEWWEASAEFSIV